MCGCIRGWFHESSRTTGRLFVWTLLILIYAIGAVCEDQPYPVWDGKESVQQYAARTRLDPVKIVDLGEGTRMELVLIPAGEFQMGKPVPALGEERYRSGVFWGKVVFWSGAILISSLLAAMLLNAIVKRGRVQYSLRWYLSAILAGSVLLLGALHWWSSTQSLRDTEKESLAFWEAHYNEMPVHGVTLTHPYYLSRHEITREQYQKVMEGLPLGLPPDPAPGGCLPVGSVSWHEAQDFCQKLERRQRLTVRLPTEAEWEFACRAGTNTDYYSGNTKEDLETVGWYQGNSGGELQPIGGLQPNAFGLFDMHGNVGEWCQDWFGPYEEHAPVDPSGPKQGLHRVIRGGSCSDMDPVNLRSSQRSRLPPNSRYSDVGFRVLVEAKCVAAQRPAPPSVPPSPPPAPNDP